MNQPLVARVPFESPRLMLASFKPGGRSFMDEASERPNGQTICDDHARLQQSLPDCAGDGTVAMRSFRPGMRGSKAGAR